MSQTANIGDLLEESGLDPGAVSQMQLTADAMGPAINAGLGDVSIDDIETSEVILVTLVIDDSSSIRFDNNTGILREGANMVPDALAGSKQSNGVLISCHYLNDGVLYPYRPLEGAVKLDTHNYNPAGGTPLYDRLEVVLPTIVTKMAEFEQGGVSARAITVIVTDGGDNSPRVQRPEALKPIVEGMLRSEAHIIMAVGISDGHTNFRDDVFLPMGIPDEWIKSPKNTESEIRAVMQLVSQSAVRASQAQGGSFSQVALGGFGQ